MVLCSVSLPGETSSAGNYVFTSDTREALCYAESVVGVFFFLILSDSPQNFSVAISCMVALHNFA